MKMIQKITIALAALLVSLSAMAQNQIHGVVCDSEGNPLPGAAVIIKGTSNGTVTDIDGKFSLTAQKGNELEVSFLGFASETIYVTNAAEYKVNLESDNAFLEETVVVGYGTQKRVNLTGSVASVSSKDFENKPIVSSSTALQGVAAGVTVTTQSGAPGADGGTIRIRGLGTFGNSSCAPLVLVDGVEGSLDAVEASQIDKISILKDAASSAIYGSRAANGVILVTTKRAVKGTRSVSYKGYLGWQEPTCLVDLVGVQDYMRLNNEESVNDGVTPTYSEDYINNYFANNAVDPDTYPITNWQQEILTGSGFTQNHVINLVAGGDKIRVNTSVGYLDQKGIIKNTDYYRINFRNNLDVDILKNLKMKVDVSGSYGRRNRLQQQNAIFADLSRRDPLTLTKWSTGYYAALSGGSLNSLSCLDGQGGNIKNDTYRINGALTLTYDPLDWLTIEGMVAPKLVFTENHNFEKKLTWYSDPYGTKSPYSNCEDSNLTESTGRGYYGNYNITANFHKTWANAHHFKALIGFSREDYSGKSLEATRYGYPYPDYEVINAGADDARKTNAGTRNQWALSSFFGRINYNYKDRYLFEANVRVDGSSRFAEDRRWGVFPSFSGAWRLSEEPFMKDSKDVMTEAKIRASYGQLGNQDIGSYYPAYQTLNIGSAISVNDVVTPIATLTTLANPDITWETTEMTDVGVDFAFWNKWNITADFYYKMTHGILLQIDIPQSIGLAAPYQNVGEVRNIGWEFSTGYHDNIGDWKWGVDFNISDVYNKIMDMGGTISGSVIRQEAGHEINSIYGLVCNGIVRSEEQAQEINATCPQYGLTVKPGDLYYADIAGAFDEDGNPIPDGKVDDSDKTYIGTTIPHLTYGITLSLGWKGINFSAFFQGVGQANAILNSYYIYPGFNGGSYRTEVLGRYNPADQSTWETATFPRLTKTDAISYRESTFWLGDASYCRLKNIQLSYTFPKKWMSKAKIKDLMIFANGQNVYTWTKFYQGYDPELSYSGSSVTSGSAYNYPQVRTWTFGLEIKF